MNPPPIDANLLFTMPDEQFAQTMMRLLAENASDTDRQTIDRLHQHIAADSAMQARFVNRLARLDERVVDRILTPRRVAALATSLPSVADHHALFFTGLRWVNTQVSTLRAWFEDRIDELSAAATTIAEATTRVMRLRSSTNRLPGLAFLGSYSSGVEPHAANRQQIEIIGSDLDDDVQRRLQLWVGPLQLESLPAGTNTLPFWDKQYGRPLVVRGDVHLDVGEHMALFEQGVGVLFVGQKSNLAFPTLLARNLDQPGDRSMHGNVEELLLLDKNPGHLDRGRIRAYVWTSMRNLEALTKCDASLARAWKHLRKLDHAQARRCARTAREHAARSPRMRIPGHGNDRWGEIGYILHTTGDIEGARDAWACRRDLLEQQRPHDLSAARSDLALALRQCGELEQARQLQEQVLADLPKTHRNHSLALANLANTLLRTGDPEAACQKTEQALAGTAEVSPLTRAILTTNLAVATHAVGRSKEAMALQQKALETLTRQLPTDDPDRARAANNHAILLGTVNPSASDIDSAVAQQQSVITAFERALPDDHPDVQSARANLIKILECKSLAVLNRMLETYRKALPDADPRIQRVRRDLARALYQAGELHRAEMLQESVVEAYSGKRPDDDPELLAARAELDTTRSHLGQMQRTGVTWRAESQLMTIDFVLGTPRNVAAPLTETNGTQPAEQDSHEAPQAEE